MFVLFCFQDNTDDDIFSKSNIPGILTKHKFTTLGTHDAVKESRRSYLMNQQQRQGMLYLKELLVVIIKCMFFLA